ncbi:MAG: anthranilate synthase component I family protein [bacterium]
MRRDEFLALAEHYKVFPVYKDIIQDTETPIGLLSRVLSNPYVFLLESIEGGEHLGRYSFLGWDVKNVYQTFDNPFPFLEKVLHPSSYTPFDFPRFWGGIVGYISYDVVRYLEKLPSLLRDPLRFPTAMFMEPDFIVAFDHVKNKLNAITKVESFGNLDTLYKEVEDKLSWTLSVIEKPKIELNDLNPLEEFPIEKCVSKEEFIRSVEVASEYIRMGEAFQIVLSQRFLFDSTYIDPFQLYRAVRFINPSPYMFFLKFKDVYIIGASPEMLVRVEDGMVEVRPIAGTRRRDKDPKKDRILEEELINNEKERAEHLMLVDLGRNDVGKVSYPGTVKVERFMDIERYSHVMHLVSSIKGQLSQGLNCVDALKAGFPAGTVSGAPKVRAMEIIEELEPFARGPYAGGVGYITPNGDMDTCITIRSIFIKDGLGYTQAGAGIVYDSIPESEYYETINKSSAMFEAIKLAGRKNGPVSR